MIFPRLSFANDQLARLPDPQSFSEYVDDPVGFAIDQLGVNPWSKQADVMISVAGHDLVAVRSGQKTGKTLLAAILSLWWVATRERGRVVCMANTHQQLKNVLWREVRAAYRIKLQEESLVHIGAKLGGPPVPPLDPLTGINFDESGPAARESKETGRQIYGMSPRDVETLQGISGDQLLFLLDEGSGIPDAIFGAVYGNLGGGGKIVTFSNPTKTSGWFFRIFHERLKLWKRIQIRSDENPNIRRGRKIVNGLATLGWLEGFREMCGDRYWEHPLYRVRVLGEFPMQSTKAIVSLTHLEAACARWLDAVEADGRDHWDLRERDPWELVQANELERAQRHLQLWIGVDVARFGDDESVIQGRRGSFLYPPEAHNGLDGPQLAAAVERYAKRCSVPYEGILPGTKAPIANVDVIGVGASCYDALRRSSQIRANPINVSERSDDEERWPNLRTQLWEAADEFLKKHGTCPPTPKLEGELLAPEYAFDAQGRKVVEPKQRTKERLDGRSPDHGDAFVLSLYEGMRDDDPSMNLSILAG